MKQNDINLLTEIKELRKKFPNNQEFGKSVASLLDSYSAFENQIATSKTLITYLGDILKEREIDPFSSSLKLEEVFGKEIHLQIDGFINFAKENDLRDTDIRTTLAHDLIGAFGNDTMMLPRVSGYKEFTNLKKI